MVSYDAILLLLLKERRDLGTQTGWEMLTRFQFSHSAHYEFITLQLLSSKCNTVHNTVYIRAVCLSSAAPAGVKVKRKEKRTGLRGWEEVMWLAAERALGSLRV